MSLFFLHFFLENFAMHVSIIYSNSINLDPKFESSFASDSSLQNRLWACNVTFSLMRFFFQSLENFSAL